jgi:hypothetical protein
MKSFSEIVDLASSTSRIANTRPQPLRDSVAGGADRGRVLLTHLCAAADGYRSLEPAQRFANSR